MKWCFKKSIHRKLLRGWYASRPLLSWAERQASVKELLKNTAYVTFAKY